MLETFFTVFVVYISLFLVGKDFVCLLEFLELLFVATAVWMLFESKLPESFSDLIISRSLLNTKLLVICLVVNWFTFTLAHATHAAHLFFKVSEGETTSTSASAAEKHV